MATVTRQQLRPRPLGRGSLAALLRLGDLSAGRGGIPVPVAELIDIQSRLEWGYVQAMASRQLVDSSAGALTLTPGGWRTYRKHRS